MSINGKEIAGQIAAGLGGQVSLLKEKGIKPKLAVLLVGLDKASEKYVEQKIKLGQKLSIEVNVSRLANTVNPESVFSLVNQWNKDPAIHGIIIQRPVAIAIETSELNNLVIRSKDVDGFHPESLFDPPIVVAVMKILENIQQLSHDKKSFLTWLAEKKILVIGRGETAGKPIAKYLTKNKLPFTVAHSGTSYLKQLTLSSDIIISAVGKPNIVRHYMISGKTILIGVGLHPENGHLATDYNQNEIAGKALFYTPVPGGVGPVNVAMLMNNVILAAEKSEII